VHTGRPEGFASTVLRSDQKGIGVHLPYSCR
jgi:hypothetical protein